MNPYTQLANKLKFDRDLPYTADWSASEDFLEIISDYCLKNKPTHIVECSSGLSTLILARCCQLNQYGKVFSLENGAEYAEKTRHQLMDFNLQDYATVIDAPLEDIKIKDEIFLWYSLASLSVESIDMLVIDGPPGFIQKNSRYPALPLLYNKLSNHCTLYLDDAGRDDEKNIVELWKKKYPAFKHQYIKTERGCSILTVK